MPHSPSAAAAASLILATTLGRFAAAQSDLSSSFAVPPGCSVSLWAESPLLYNPTAIDIDPQGRVWVTEAVNYRQWDGRNPGLHRDEGDRVVVLEDKDGDGVAETSTVFAQDKDLVAPLGICWLPDKVLVSCSPTVWAYYDDDHDGKADRKEVFLTGFGGHDHDHGAHSFSVGPDGRLYMALGNAGPHIVTDKSGWTLRSGSCYTGGGQFEAPNKPGLVSDDGHVYVGGLILRCNQDGTGLTVMAHNFRNPYEVAVDAFGDMWTFDNDDDGNQCCRATWVMEGGNYGYFSADGSRYWQADKRPGQSVFRAHWHQDDPGVVPTTLITGSGGPTGVCVYEGDALPGMQGALLCADAGRSCVYALKRVPDGAGFKLLPVEGAPPVNGLAPDGQQLTGLLVSKPAKDGDESWHLFRPSDVCVAPDGSVIVADWFDPGVGGHMAQDRKAYGRLLRISAAGASSRLEAATPAASHLDEVVGGLASPAQSVRVASWAALREDASSQSKLREAVAAASTHGPRNVLARDIYAQARSMSSGLAALPSNSATGAELRDGGWWPKALEDQILWLRAARAAGARPLLVARTARMVDGPGWAILDAATREAAMALAQWPDGSLAERDWLTWVYQEEVSALPEGVPRSALEMIGSAFAPVAESWRPHGTPDALANPVVTPSSRWSPAQAAIAWRLHPAALVPDFAARVMSASLDHAAREQALTALAFCTTREAADAMLAAALAGPVDTRELAAWWVKHNDGNVWRDFGLAQHLVAHTEWTDADIVWRSGPVTHGSVPVNVDVTGSKRIALVVTPSDNGNGCDWSDWLSPEIFFNEQDVGDVQNLAVSPPIWESATAEWGHVNIDHNCDGGPLSVDGKTYQHGIGTHARSEIVFSVPQVEGMKASLVAQAAVDDGGSKQPNAPTKVEFIVYADHALKKQQAATAAAARLDELLATLRDPARELDARAEAAETLATDPAGGARLLAEAAAGRLDALDSNSDTQRELHDALAAAIFRNPDLGVRALASEHFKRPGAPSLPPIADIAALAGDRHAGAALFFGTARCSTCHAVNGRGGDVGPDLTQIRTKYGRAQLLDSILNPSAAIGAGFESVTLTLKDGSVLAGLVQADGAQVLLKDGTGKRHVIEAADITERRASKLSLMPDDIAYSLSPQQLADLCAFLQHDPTPPPKLGPPIELWNGTDLSGWVAVPDTSAWSVREVAGAPVLHDEGQPIGYIRTERPFTSFDLTVDWRFPDPARPGNSGVLLRVQSPDKVWPRSIESQLDSGNAGDIWNIDAFGMDVDPARTEGRRTVKLQPSSEKPLGEWNTYHITLRDGDLTLEVNGQVQNRARWCEEVAGSIALQSEGAPIEFRKVELREIEE